MRRRNLIQFGFVATISLLAGGPEALCADDDVAWGATTDSLQIGLRLEAAHGLSRLIVLLKNVGSAPRDLYLWDGEIPRIDFAAMGADGKEYKLNDRQLYRPCAGLCGWPPTIKRLEAYATVKVTLALDELLYVPSKGPYTTLRVLLQEGCSVRAAFQITEQQLKDGKLSPELSWLGRATSGEARKH